MSNLFTAHRPNPWTMFSFLRTPIAWQFWTPLFLLADLKAYKWLCCDQTHSTSHSLVKLSHGTILKPVEVGIWNCHMHSGYFFNVICWKTCLLAKDARKSVLSFKGGYSEYVGWRMTARRFIKFSTVNVWTFERMSRNPYFDCKDLPLWPALFFFFPFTVHIYI